MAALTGSSPCTIVSDEGLICTLAADHIGDNHRDLSDPSTEIEWRKPRAPQVMTLGELVADVDDRVRARTAALLAQAPGLPLGYEPPESACVVDEVASFAATEPRGLLAGLHKIFPARRASPGARRTGRH